MTVSLDEMMAGLDPARRRKIEDRTADLVAEEMTLRRTVEAMGGRLSLIARFPTGPRSNCPASLTAIPAIDHNPLHLESRIPRGCCRRLRRVRYLRVAKFANVGFQASRRAAGVSFHPAPAKPWRVRQAWGRRRASGRASRDRSLRHWARRGCTPRDRWLPGRLRCNVSQFIRSSAW